METVDVITLSCIILSDDQVRITHKAATQG